MPCAVRCVSQKQTGQIPELSDMAVCRGTGDRALKKTASRSEAEAAASLVIERRASTNTMIQKSGRQREARDSFGQQRRRFRQLTMAALEKQKQVAISERPQSLNDPKWKTNPNKPKPAAQKVAAPITDNNVNIASTYKVAIRPSQIATQKQKPTQTKKATQNTKYHGGKSQLSPKQKSQLKYL